MNDPIFIFLGSKSMDNSRQFENHQMGFIKNLYEKKIINFKHVIMSTYIQAKHNFSDDQNIKLKTKKMEEMVKQNFFHLDIIYINGKTFKSIFQTLKKIRKKSSLFNRKIIFSQNYFSGFIGLLLKKSLNNSYLHLNLRGVPAEEELTYSNSSFPKRVLNFLILKWMEKKIISGSDSLSVVSGHFKKYLKNKFKTGLKPIVVYPCVYNCSQFYVDKKLRKIYRERFGAKDNQKLFIYSGSMNKYQMPFEIFRFYDNISKQDREGNYLFIFLTFEKEEAIRLSKSFKIHNLIIESGDEKDLLGIYNACDIGVICRKKDIINRVASPTKIAEYLSTGNSIIMTEGIGDYSGDLRDKKFALVKKDINSFLKTPLNEIMDLKPPDENDLEWIKTNYSNDKINIFNEIFCKTETTN